MFVIIVCCYCFDCYLIISLSSLLTILFTAANTANKYCVYVDFLHLKIWVKQLTCSVEV